MCQKHVLDTWQHPQILALRLRYTDEKSLKNYGCENLIAKMQKYQTYPPVIHLTQYQIA